MFKCLNVGNAAFKYMAIFIINKFNFTQKSLLVVFVFVVFAAFFVPKMADAQSTHPFMIVKSSEYSALQVRATQDPWKTMKADAITTINNSAVSDRGYTMANTVTAGALAYILDPANRSAYKTKLASYITTSWQMMWDTDRLVNFDPNAGADYDWKVKDSAAFFESVLALDIIYNDLTSTELANIEFQLKRVADEYYGRPDDEYTIASYGMWALYKGDRLRIDSAKSLWKSNYLGLLSNDGVFKDGPDYMIDSIETRVAKMAFFHVLEYTGEDNTYYTNRRVIGFYEWLTGGATTPFRKIFSFSDSKPDKYSRLTAGANWYAGLFSQKAAKYGAWMAQDQPAPNATLINYVLAKSLAVPEQPKSNIWRDGSAVFWGNTVSAKALNGGIWNLKSIAGSNDHPHKEVNSLNLSAYGEYVLRNSGYAGWGNGDLGFSWDYIHNKAESGNTVLINGVDHQYKYGLGITEGFISNNFDYARGDSGSALPNGKHYRNFVFIHPQDGGNGYWLLFDEVAASTAGNSANVLLHPNADNITTVLANREYRSTVAPNRNNTAENVYLTTYLGTNPNSVSIKDGLLAGNNSFIGKYLYSSYNTDSVTGKKNIVTVLFPHDATHAKATMSSISGTGYSGASIDLGSSIVDTALESQGSSTISHGSVSFLGTAIWYRKNVGNTTAYFVRGGRSFNDGLSPRKGFSSNTGVSIHLRDKLGSIYVPGTVATPVTIYHPGVTSAKLNGTVVTNSSSGSNWITISVPVGNHALELISGVVAPTPTPTPASCTLPWGGTIASGSSITAYYATPVACGSTCTSQTRTCTNGTLSGTYTKQSCTVSACPTPTPTPTPIQLTGWTWCAYENGTCSFTGTKEVRFGTSTQSYTKTLSTSTLCTWSVFGDPAPGSAKQCHYRTAPTPTPTPTLIPTATPTPAPAVTYENHPITNQTSLFIAEFDATPTQANSDVIVGLSNVAVDAYADTAALIRFNNANQIDSRNAGAYTTQTTLNYIPNTTYHVRMDINIPNKTYTIYVTPQGGAQTVIAQHYAFRTEQNTITNINNWAKVTTSGGATIANFTIKPVQTLPTSTNPIYYWKFNEGTGTSIADSSGNNNRLTLTGGMWGTGKLGSAITFSGL